MVPEFPRDVFVYNSHLIGRIGVECLLERVAGWCVFFWGAWGNRWNGTAFKSLSGSWTVRARTRAIFDNNQPRRVLSMPTFSNFLRNIFCRLYDTIGVLCLSFQDSWRARRLFSTWWLRVVVHKHGMCLDGIWLFQLLWLRFLMQTVCRLEGVFSKLQSFGMVKY